ncbi:MAG: type III pantothenate kinase, partial [Gammaproteobacteria bacterium]
MRLLLDIGNTRIKWAWTQGEELLEPGELTHRDEPLDELVELMNLAQHAPEDIFAVNVAGAELGDAISGAIRSRVAKPVKFMVTSEKVGEVSCGYSDCSQLGVDRWAAIIGAWSQYQTALCVVDAGTAITVDLITAAGQHLGGYIAPGVHLMNEALKRETGDIERLAARTGLRGLESSAPGTSTEAAVSHGAILAVTGLIDRGAGVLAELVT